MSADDAVRDAAERNVLGAMMLAPQMIVPVREILDCTQFYRPANGLIFDRIVKLADAGTAVDATVLGADLDAAGDLGLVGGLAYLGDLIAGVPIVANATYYARIVHDRFTRREVARIGLAYSQAAELSDSDRRAARLLTLADEVATLDARPAGRTVGGRELDAFLSEQTPKVDFLVPGLIEHGDRLIVTGGEGHGKSTFLRQIGVQAASGIHPFGGDDFEPLRVLLVDLENTDRQVRRKLNPIRLAAGDRYGGCLVVEVRPEGIDLLSATDVDWLLAMIDRHSPDLLIIGPLYKMHSGDPIEEGPARAVAAILDRIRTRHRLALILEAHSPHAAAGGKRPIRPYGASLWLRWPEFGLHLGETGTLSHWRTPRDEREWPAVLQRGGKFPWTPVSRPRDALWSRIRQLCAEADDQLSIRDLAEMTGSGRSTVQRTIDEHKNEWDALAFPQVSGGGTA